MKITKERLEKIRERLARADKQPYGTGDHSGLFPFAFDDMTALLGAVYSLSERLVFMEKALGQAIEEGSIRLYANGSMYFGSYEYATCSMPTAKDVPELAEYLRSLPLEDSE